MKKLILLALIPLALAACQKAGTSPTKPIIIAKDTIPDGSRFNVKLVKDSTFYDEIQIAFAHNFHNTYTNYDEDSTVPTQNPTVSLSAISSDGVLLNLDGVPYTPGISIPLNTTVKTSGPYFLKLSYLYKIPATIHVWCIDNYSKDSLDLRTGNYHFNIDNADTNSFGKKRFQIVVR